MKTKLACLTGLILASIACGSASANTLSETNTCSSCTNTLLMNSTKTIHLAGTVEAVNDGSAVTYLAAASSASILSSHSTGTVVQAAKLTVPGGAAGVKISSENVAGANAAHAAVVLRAAATGGTDVTTKQAALTGVDEFYVALINSDGTAWTAGTTVANPVVTFYQS